MYNRGAVIEFHLAPNVGPHQERAVINDGLIPICWCNPVSVMHNGSISIVVEWSFNRQGFSVF
jgi:hypothetical protein